MGEKPTTTNKTLGTVEAIINGAAMKALAPALDQLVKSYPALAWLRAPVVSQIVTAVINWLCQQLSILMQMTGVKFVLTIQTNEEEAACEKAEGELRAALLKGDKDEIARASEASDKAFGGLIHWDGSSPITR